MATLAGWDSAARIALVVTGSAFALSEVTIRLRSRVHRDSVRMDRGSVVAVVGAIAAGVVAAAWWAATGTGAARSVGAGAALFGGGIAAMWIGIALRLWAVRVLGPCGSSGRSSPSWCG